MICAFNTNGISDGVGKESLRKLFYNILVLHCQFREV
jgi:hypothetical protein